ncbi:MAG TPA: HEAT repeat domain-containing protein [Gallionella sp.]
MLSEHLAQLVVWLSIALSVLILLLLVQIALLRIGLVRRTAREQRFLKVWQPILAAAVAGEPGDLPPLADDEKIFFMKLWNHLHESLRGKARRQLNVIALRCGILQDVYALLGRKDLRSRLLALITLGHLGDRSSWNNILKLTRHRDPLLSLVAARTLFQIHPESALTDLMQPLLEREDWPTAQLALLLQEAGQENIFAMLAKTASQLAGSTDPAGLARLNRLLRLLEVAPYQLVIAAIRAIFAVTADAEIIAQCLKFLREPNDLPTVMRHLDHPDWVVRLQVAQALGRIGTARDTTQLAKLLSDPVWWVRYRAAQAMVSLMRGNSPALAELRTRLTDRYAQDALEMVLTERGGR